MANLFVLPESGWAIDVSKVNCIGIVEKDWWFKSFSFKVIVSGVKISIEYESEEKAVLECQKLLKTCQEHDYLKSRGQIKD